MYKQLEGLVLESAGGPQGKNASKEASKTAWQPQKKVETHFADGMVGNFHLQKPRTFWDFLVSVLGHSFVVALLILLPLYFTDAINIQQLQNTLLVAPPPPAPPPPPEADSGVTGGVPGGVPGGQLGGVLGGILGGTGQVPTPPPPKPVAHKGPYRVKVMSGSPLLVGAVMQALEQWRYQPTLLNGQPVAVDMLVTLHFQLGQHSRACMNV